MSREARFWLRQRHSFRAIASRMTINLIEQRVRDQQTKKRLAAPPSVTVMILTVLMRTALLIWSWEASLTDSESSDEEEEEEEEKVPEQNNSYNVQEILRKAQMSLRKMDDNIELPWWQDVMEYRTFQNLLQRRWAKLQAREKARVQPMPNIYRLSSASNLDTLLRQSSNILQWH